MKHFNYLMVLAAIITLASCGPEKYTEPEKKVYPSYDPVTVGIGQYSVLVGEYAISDTEVVHFASGNSYAEDYLTFLPNQFEYFGVANGNKDMLRWPIIDTRRHYADENVKALVHDFCKDTLYADDTTHIILDVWYTDTTFDTYDTIITKIEKVLEDDGINSRTGETVIVKKDTSYNDTTVVTHTFNKIQHAKCIGWRAPSREEMEYILAHHVHGIATVCERPGMIILPKGCDINFIADATDWATNTFNYQQWTELQSKGVIFLPATGLGDDIDVNKKEAELGAYWLGSRTLEGIETYRLEYTSEYASALHSCKNSHEHNLRMILLPEYELTYILEKGTYTKEQVED